MPLFLTQVCFCCFQWCLCLFHCVCFLFFSLFSFCFFHSYVSSSLSSLSLTPFLCSCPYMLSYYAATSLSLNPLTAYTIQSKLPDNSLFFRSFKCVIWSRPSLHVFMIVLFHLSLSTLSLVCVWQLTWVQHLKFELSRTSLRSLQLLYEGFFTFCWQDVNISFSTREY